MYDVGYAMMRRQSLQTEEEVKQHRKIDDTLISLTHQTSTGLPDWLGAFQADAAG